MSSEITLSINDEVFCAAITPLLDRWMASKRESKSQVDKAFTNRKTVVLQNQKPPIREK